MMVFPSVSACLLPFVVVLLLFHDIAEGFQQSNHIFVSHSAAWFSALYSSNTKDDGEQANLLTDRLPTSVDDQIRQAKACIENANNDSVYRHCIRLLLPIIGATELDDWPGGARQQREAALPLVQAIVDADGADATANVVMIDKSDGVGALMVQQGSTPEKDSCSVLLPTAESFVQSGEDIDQQVGPQRNLLLVNPQWRRKSDFGGGGFLGLGGGKNDKIVQAAESFQPTFSLTSLICEGESIRVLRTYGRPWRVYVREEKPNEEVEWNLVGTQPFVLDKPNNWEDLDENKRDGGLLFSFGQPTYQDIMQMLKDSPSYTMKGPAERAAVAFNFIKDSI